MGEIAVCSYSRTESTGWAITPRIACIMLICVLGLISAVRCNNGERNLETYDRVKVGAGQLADLGVSAYLRQVTRGYRVTVILTRGMLPPEHELLTGKEFDVQLISRAGSPLPILEAPPRGVLHEVGGPGITASFSCTFCGESDLRELGKLIITHKGESLCWEIHGGAL